MELTRRDAAAALAAVGASGGAVLAGRRLRDHADDNTDATPTVTGGEGGGDGLPDDERVYATLTALAEVVYPSEVTGIEAFVEGFLAGRLTGTDHARGIRETVVELDDRGQAWHGNRVSQLSPGTRNRLLRDVGADTAEENPDGTTAERVRYFLINELLIALYASPTGGELVGLENPRGHPGGTESYTTGPQ